MEFQQADLLVRIKMCKYSDRLYRVWTYLGPDWDVIWTLGWYTSRELRCE